jgi:anti-anti-sigma factor
MHKIAGAQSLVICVPILYTKVAGQSQLEETSMDIQVTTANGRVPVTIMHVNGNIDAQSYEQFQSKADELINNGTRYLLIDLSQAPFVSSAGLRALHHIFNDLRSRDSNAQLSEEDVRRGISSGTYKSPNLKLLKLSKETRTAFELSGFDMFIDSFEDEGKAIASF